MRRVVILLKASTVSWFVLAWLRISFMRWAGVSMVPEVSEPSNRIIPWLRVFASMVWSHLSRRLAKRMGIWRRFGAWWLLPYCVLKYERSRVL